MEEGARGGAAARKENCQVTGSSGGGADGEGNGGTSKATADSIGANNGTNSAEGATGETGWSSSAL